MVTLSPLCVTIPPGVAQIVFFDVHLGLPHRQGGLSRLFLGRDAGREAIASNNQLDTDKPQPFSEAGRRL